MHLLSPSPTGTDLTHQPSRNRQGAGIPQYTLQWSLQVFRCMAPVRRRCFGDWRCDEEAASDSLTVAALCIRGGALSMALIGADGREKVIAFVVDEDESGEVDDFDFPDGFHPQFRELDNLN